MPKPPNNQAPSRNPADEETLEGLLNIFWQKQIEKHENRILARVLSFDRAAGTVSVQPLSRLVGTDGTEIDRAAYQGIPVEMAGAGGMIISTPIKAGDIGWLKAGDKDNSILRQGDYEQTRGGNTLFQHKFSNGTFQPLSIKSWSKWSGGAAAQAFSARAAAQDDGVLNPNKIRQAADAADNADETTFIGTRDGNSRVAMESGALRLIATEIIEMMAQNAEIRANVISAVFQTASFTGQTLEISANVKIKGNLAVEGGDVKADRISLKEHKHGGVQTGGGDTGKPK